MKCPVCNRNLAPTLSICLTCGTMMNDTVREELQTKVSGMQLGGNRASFLKLNPPKRIELPPIPKPETAELATKETSPTLVEFQTKTATLPDWRLQLQNSVRQRAAASPDTTYRKQLVTSGANAMAVEFVEDIEPTIEHENPKVANALKRIANSRKTFLPEPAVSTEIPESRQPIFGVITPTADAAERTAESKASVNVLPKPRLVIAPPTIDEKKFDTNKLPPIEEVTETEVSSVMPDADPDVIHISKKLDDNPADTEIAETEEIEDLAPFAMRFNAGLFDLIIAGFASLILLTPFIAIRGNWFTYSGLPALAAVYATVLFIYMTASVGLFGKTIGMRMFSLELIDADENAYPTLHQAAVNSAVYLLSLPLAGAGFLPLLFNEEKRAFHDIVSGTIMVKEF